MLEKLSPISLKCFDAAKQQARRLKSPDLNPRHLILGMIQQQRSWFENLVKPYNLNADQVARAFEADLGVGSGQPSDKLSVSAELKAALQDSVTLAQDKPVTPAHLLLSLLRTDERTRMLFGNLNIRIEQIESALDEYGASVEAIIVSLPTPATPAESDSVSAGPTQVEQPRSEVMHKPTPTLDRYSRDLTQLARQGQLYPVLGRDREIASTIEILCRQMKRNPILVGEPGVGKTALAEGLAQRIVQGNVPSPLQDKRLVELSVSSLVAGASQIGEFEKRLRKLVSEVKEAGDVILFIDETHTLMGAGGMYGLQDAATILKPALARGEIVCIGSTTTHEYRKYIEKDGALARRFQPVRVEEPDREDVLRILATLKPRFEAHFGVRIPNELLPETYELAKNYLKNRYFPDKAIDLLERSASRAMLVGISKASEGQPALDVDIILSVLSDITGIPLEKLDQGEMERYLHLEEILRRRVIGQDQAIQTVSSLIRLVKRRLDLDPKRPDGIFLFVGPAGVGKTELAKALTEFLFGDEDRLIRIDMSEFSSEFTVSRLIGSPPGYVGYDQGGQLTEKVHQQPFCVILLDEIEKAHFDVLNLFLQVFDDGRLTDGQGRTVYFSDATIIMTSNLVSDLWLRRRMGFGEDSDTQVQVTEEAVMDVLRRKLSAEFLSRIDEVVIFAPLSDQAVAEIARTKLDRIVHSRFKRQEIQISFTPQVVEYVVRQGYDPRLGCRRLERVIQKQVLEPLAEQMYCAEWQHTRQVRVDLIDGKLTFFKEA